MIWSLFPLHATKTGYWRAERSAGLIPAIVAGGFKPAIGAATSDRGRDDCYERDAKHRPRCPWEVQKYDPDQQHVVRGVCEICDHYLTSGYKFAAALTDGSREYQQLDFSKLGNAVVYVLPQQSIADDNANVLVGKYDHAIHVYPLDLMSHLWAMELRTYNAAAVDWRVFYHWAGNIVNRWGMDEESIHALKLAGRGNGAALTVGDSYYNRGARWVAWKKKNADVDKRIRKHFIVYDGKVIDPKDNALCRNCPKKVERGIGRCMPLVFNCIAAQQFGAQILEADQPDLAAMFGNDNLREHKDCVSQPNFETNVAGNMFTGKLTRDKIHEVRATRASKSTVTRRGKKTVCANCLLHHKVTAHEAEHCGKKKIKEGDVTCDHRLHSCGMPVVSDDIFDFMPLDRIPAWKLHAAFEFGGRWLTTIQLRSHPKHSKAKSREAAILLPKLHESKPAQWSGLREWTAWGNETRWVSLWVTSTRVKDRIYMPYPLLCTIFKTTEVTSFDDIRTRYPWVDMMPAETLAAVNILLQHYDGSDYRPPYQFKFDVNTVKTRRADIVSSKYWRYKYGHSLAKDWPSRRNIADSQLLQRWLKTLRGRLPDWRKVANEMLVTMIASGDKFAFDGDLQRWRRIACEASEKDTSASSIIMALHKEYRCDGQ